MRILHTSDWHLGKEWYGVSRTPDLTDHVIPEIVDIALRNQVDLLVVAGDLLEGFGRESLKQCSALLRQPIRQLLEAGVNVAVIPGNHDSWPLFRLLEAALDVNPLTRPARLVVFTQPRLHNFGQVQVLGIPYLPLQSFSRWLADQGIDLPVEADLQNQTLSVQFESVIQSLKQHRLDGRRPALLIGHFAVSGSRMTPATDGDERSYAGYETSYARDLVINRDTLLNSDQVPQYNALGHMHLGQRVLETVVPTFYAGAPDRFDRGEVGYQPHVLIVDLPEVGTADTGEVPITSATVFLKERVSCSADLQAIAERLGAESSRRALGDLTIRVDDATEYPALRDEAYELFPRLREANTVRLDSPDAPSAPKFETTTDYSQIADPRAVFNDYFSRDFMEADRPHLFRALDSILEELAHED